MNSRQFAKYNWQLAMLVVLLFSWFSGKSNSVFTTDTMTYSINLEIPENAHLQTLPEEILKSYVLGIIHAYYPKREMNEILLDDFLAHYGKTNFNCGAGFCWSDYADHPYLKELYEKFKHEIRYKEVIYYDAQHSVVKREIIWLQLMYTDYDNNGELKTTAGPKFWFMELNTDKSLRVPNPYNPSQALSIQQEFDERHFVPNEIGRENLKEKSSKADNASEN